MSIYFYSYPSLYINRGGPAYKTRHLAKHLNMLGEDVKFFDMWDSSFKYKEEDIFYIFTANVSTYPLAVNLVSAGMRYVVNPIFFSNHSAQTIKTYRNLEKPFKRIFKRTMSDYDFTETICKDAELILPNTMAESELLKNSLNLKHKKFKVIENGVEKRFAEADPQLFIDKHGIKDFVLYVGHLGSVRKNGINILKAMQKLDHQCVVVADIFKNKEGEICRQIIEDSPNIKYLGWLDHESPMLESAYAACHTFILPTRYETPGRAALEAALAGANIVITPNGGTKEYFKNYALYPDPSSIESILKTTREALERDPSPKLKEHVYNNYIWEVIAKKTMESINEI